MDYKAILINMWNVLPKVFSAFGYFSLTRGECIYGTSCNIWQEGQDELLSYR